MPAVPWYCVSVYAKEVITEFAEMSKTYRFTIYSFTECYSAKLLTAEEAIDIINRDKDLNYTR